MVDTVSKQNIQIDGEAVSVSLVAAIYSGVPTRNTTIEAVIAVLRRRLDEALTQSGKDGGNSIVSSTQAGEAGTISVEGALQMLERDDTSGLSPYVKALMTDLLPLIEYADAEFILGLQASDLTLREKLPSSQ